MYATTGKRVVDVAASAVLLVVLAPLLLTIALAVMVLLGRPAVFRQARPGHGGRVFTLFKFRTMTDARGHDGELLSDAERLTPFGRWLRATSLDELPELINVLRGDMSLVGPRPLLVRYLARYTPEQARRHDVRPGITGWAQVNGRNALSWERKFAHDVWYVDHVSLTLDLRILVQTMRALVRPADINEPGHVTAREFMGSTS